MPRCRIIGPGRVGRSLAIALDRAGWAVVDLLGRDDDVTGAARGVDVVLVTTPDRDVDTVARAVAPEDDVAMVHTSGSLRLDVLAHHRRRASMHPLASIADPVRGAEVLSAGISFATAGDPVVADLVDALGGRAFPVDDEHRDAYHAAAAIASNHLVALLGQVERVAAGAGLPLDAYLDLVRRTVDNVEALGPPAALTGPVARRDVDTVRRHLDAVGPAERDGYLACAHLAARLVGAEPALAGLS
ncbi:MAG: DUF2520 domain-containing protein [Actinomycetota bacterium]|nr:DUF2520 domain-containing protein [Actinomycetota bacterium]